MQSHIERNTAMLNHDHDASSVAHSGAIAPGPDEQSRLIEQVILFAFDTLGVRHLDVRVCGAGQEARRSPWSLPP
jgi:hypothetical protein